MQMARFMSATEETSVSAATVFFRINPFWATLKLFFMVVSSTIISVFSSMSSMTSMKL